MPTISPPAPKQFALYLPKAPAEEVDTLVSAVESFICRCFGGLTTYPAVGMYQNKNGEIQREEVFVLEGFGELETWDKDGAELYSLAAALAVILKQETIGCSVDGRMFFVEPQAEDNARMIDLSSANLVDYLEAQGSSSSRLCPW